MDEQLSYVEISNAMRDEGKKATRNSYVTPCGGCECRSCSNNVDCQNVKIGENEFECFNCDDCHYYSGSGQYNIKEFCKDHKKADYYAQNAREKLRNISKKDW